MHLGGTDRDCVARIGLVLLLTASTYCISCSADQPADTAGDGAEAPDASQAPGTAIADTGVGAGDAGGVAGDSDGNPDAGTDPLQEADPPATPSATDAGTTCSGDDCEPGPADAGDCGALVLETGLVEQTGTGTVLLVYDRSGSMAEAWGASTRWEAARAALTPAIEALANPPGLGAVFFPSSDPDAEPMCIDPTGVACMSVPGLMVVPGSCEVSPIGENDQIAFTDAASFVSALHEGVPPRVAPVPMGLTPLLAALERADEALSSAPGSDRTTVIIVTDGMPNCDWDMTPAISRIEDWRENGIETHVLGIAGADDATTVYSALVSAGAGDVVIAADPAALQDAFETRLARAVVVGAASCTLTVEPVVTRPDLLHLVARQQGDWYEVDADLGGGSGWTLAADGASIELTGALCEAARAGEFQALEAQLGCVELPPLPAP